MKLSKKGEYALRTMINLGIAAEMKRPLVQVSELAGSERLPAKFLEQIMQELKEAGLVMSQRGKFGGYRLSKPGREITVGQIVRLIDGPLAPIGCVSQSAYERCTCPDENHCGLRMLMLDVRNAIAGILDRYTLGDVVGVTLSKMQRHDVPVPFSENRNRILPPRKSPRIAPKPNRSLATNRLTEVDGVLHQLLGDYAI